MGRAGEKGGRRWIMDTPKPINVDGEGFEILKDAVVELLNQYPGLNGRVISRSDLSEDGGISMEPESGTLVYSEKSDIVGNIRQECQFPFYVVYRTDATSEYVKAGTNDFLDKLGAWACREPVTIGGKLYQLEAYPPLTGSRKITKAVRFNSYALEPNENKTQDWLIPITVNYTHEFTRR